MPKKLISALEQCSTEQCSLMQCSAGKCTYLSHTNCNTLITIFNVTYFQVNILYNYDMQCSIVLLLNFIRVFQRRLQF